MAQAPDTADDAAIAAALADEEPPSKMAGIIDFEKRIDGDDFVGVSEAGAVLGNSDEMGERVQKLHGLGVRNILLHDLSGNFDALHQFAEGCKDGR